MKLIRYIAAGLLAAGTSLALAAPVSATEPEPGPACGTWQFAYAKAAYPAPLVSGGPSSTDGASATLKKPTDATPPESAGVEFAAKDLEIDGPTTIRVHYTLSDGATDAAGAVRLFGYVAQDADTLTDTPDYSDAAEGGLSTGTLEFTTTGPLGTLGLVYDASNATAGTVVFDSLRVGELSGRFEACPETESPSPEPEATTPPATTKPTPGATQSPLPTLPQTPGASSTKLAVLGGIAGALLLAGAGAFLLARGRRTRYTAE